MSWSALANNQMVNQDDAQSSPFSLNSGQSHGSGQLCFTKAMALTKYNLDASAMSAYASNQLVPKQVWASGSVTPTPVGYTFSQFSDGDWTAVCGLPASGNTFWSLAASLSLGDTLYTASDLITPVNGLNNYWKQDTGLAFQINNSGVITDIQTC